ncbi:MAG: tRNA 2-thiouridine(34) synthase MnmA [Alistipes sp.]|nr:tRNA 2-thiouridine(34) synthase MnmA [Candidatus Alistipes equi]
MAKIVVGLSGGVDSSVAAALLKQQGHEVIGLFMRNWHDTTGTLEGDCPWHDDEMFAELVAKKLDIAFRTVDLSEQYKARVVDYMFAEYEKGRTPNPDVLCNREIKFDVFLDVAKKMGAEMVATGHYCRKMEKNENGTIVYSLLAGSDPNKDQSYFLCQLSQQQLRYALFPIGHMLKSEVREIATKLGLATAKRKDSQGICFVGKVDLPVFLQQKLKSRVGNVHEILPSWPKYEKYAAYTSLEERSQPYRYTVRDGKKIGTHKGAQFYTIGQRKGLGIGGRKESLFIIGTDVTSNTIYVGEGENHPGLYRKVLRIVEEEIHWIDPKNAMQENEQREYMVRIRYRQPLQRARLIKQKGNLYIEFFEAQRGITAGQFAAWYDGEHVIGSGVIHE